MLKCTVKISHDCYEIIDAQQTKLRNNYKNTKLKLLKTNAAIWFNKICKIKHIKPNYINIKINGNKQRDKKTTSNAVRYRIKKGAIMRDFNCTF